MASTTCVGIEASEEVISRHQSEVASEVSETEGRKRCHPGVAVAVLAIFLVFGLVYHVRIGRFITVWMAECAKLGWGAAVILFLVSALFNVLMLPSFPLMVVAGVEFSKMYGATGGTIVGIISVFCGQWLGSVLAFQLGRTIWKGRGLRRERQAPMFQVLGSMIEEHGIIIVFLARMSPLLPAEMFNYACALTNLTLLQYSLGCLGSLLPVSLWVMGSAQAMDAVTSSRRHPRNDAILIVLNVLILLVLTVLLGCSYHKYKKRTLHLVTRNCDGEACRVSSIV